MGKKQDASIQLYTDPGGKAEGFRYTFDIYDDETDILIGSGSGYSKTRQDAESAIHQNANGGAQTNQGEKR